jgi:gliding motility-associated-like protein
LDNVFIENVLQLNKLTVNLRRIINNCLHSQFTLVYLIPFLEGKCPPPRHFNSIYKLFNFLFYGNQKRYFKNSTPFNKNNIDFFNVLFVFFAGSKYVSDAPFAISSPTSTSNSAFTYFSSMPNVGTINGNTTTIKGLGTATITALQPASGSFNAGSIATTLTVTYAPPAISYSSPNIFTKGVAISNLSPVSTGGAVTSYSIYPPLPYGGLSFNTVTGVISGTPLEIASPVTYTVTATNPTSSTTAIFTIEVKDVAPSALSYSTPNVYSVGTSISTLFPSNSGGTITNYTISPSLPGGLVLNPVTGAISGTPSLALATTTYTITGTNSGGSTSTTISIRITDTAPTSLEYSTPIVLFKGVLITPLTPSNSGGAIVSYAISPSLPAGLTLNTTTGAITGRPTVPSANTDYAITGTNTGGTVSKTISILVNDNEPTDLSYTTPNIFGVGVAITPLTPTVYGGVVTRYSIDRSLPAGLNFNTTTGVISGTPTQITANATYTVTAFNFMGRSSASIEITIGGPASNLSYGGNLILARNAIMTTVTPTVNTTTSTTYSVSPSLPLGLVFDTATGQIFGMPTTIQAAQNYTVTANNGFAPNATVTFTIQVVDVPVLSYVTPSNYTAGVAISNLIPTVSGLTPITFSIAPSLPSGMLFDTTTGVISGTPTSYTPTANYTITATNAVGSTPVTIPITVNKRIPSIGTMSIGTKTFGDANFDIVNPSTNSSGTFSYVSSNTAVATISGNTVSITGAGSATITANLASDADYDIGSTTATLTVNKAIPAIGSIAPITKTFGDATFNLTAPTTNSTGAFSYASSDSNVASIIGNTVTIVGAGTATITVSQAGDANYDPGSVSTTITVNKAVATLSAMPPVTKNFGDASFNLVAPTSAATGAITFVSSNTNVATINGNTISIIGAGTATITATQATDSNYLEATTSTTLTVNKIAPTIGSMSAISKTFGDANFTIIPPSTNSTGAFAYTSSDTNVATISGDLVSIVGAGTATISVDQATDSNYLAAATSVSLTVNKAPVVFGTTTAITKNYGDADFILTPPQTNSTGAFTYSSNNPSIATINGNLVTIQGIGTTTITVNQATTTNYLSGSTTISLVVNKTLPAIGSIAPITKTFGDATFNLTAPTTNSTGAFSYASSDSNVASIIGNTVTIVGAGTATITVSQAGDANYDPGSVSTTITVNKAVATLSAMPSVTKNFGDASFNLVAPTSAATGAITYVSSNTNVATINGNTISIIGAGTSTITASQATDANYLEATTSATLTVNKIAPTLGSMPAISKTFGDANFTIIPPSTNSTGAFAYTSSDTNVATITGDLVSIVGAGTATISVDQATDSNYLAAVTSVSLTVNKAPVVFGTTTAITKNYGDVDFILTPPQTNSTGAFTYSSNNPSIATINGNLVTIQGIGTTTITVNQATTTNYLSGSTTISLVVNKTLPAIGSIAPITKTFGDATFNLTAPTTNSTGAFSYASSDSNVASIIGNTVTIVGAGTATITVSQAGDANYDPGSVSTTITVNKAVATLSAMPSVTKNFGDASFNLVAPTSAATGAITYVSSNTNVATISGSTISIIGAGTATITATQATDSNYLEATTSTTLTVNKSTPVLSNFNPISKTTDDGQFALIAPTSSGGTGLITYISSNPSVATISGNMVTITGSGSTLITATKESDTNFNAQSISAQLTVGVGITQTPVLTSPRNNTTGATTLQINYILPEAPLPGSVQLVFTPSTGGTPIVWVMNNLTSVSFAYPVGTNPTLLSNVVSGTALAFTTYNITISYQDVFASPTASSTNTNIQTLAPPSISLAQNNYGGVINKDLTPIVTINSGGLIESYTINPALPNGVTINSTTGVVSGRPSRASAVINYTITATNPAGSSNASFGLFIDEDTDGDGIGNLTDPDIDGDKIPNNPDADVNGDGIIDNGTDTDGDGINDANDPDIDGDGVPNTQEILDGTNPNVPGAKDTDGDGVPDYIETQQGTNPNIPGAKDSDGDGVPDYIEQLQGTNPNLSGDGLDTDGDGLPDYNEGYVFSNPKLSSDEDNNGILDYLQFNNHVSVDDDLEIFNSMTVNGDGLNDVFVIRGIDQYPNNTVTIYNRWGIEVYKEDGYGQDNKFFRGISEGRVTISQSAELPKGTYFYIVRYVNKEAVEKQRSGYLYITK